MATVIGPLIEVPVLIGSVYVALWIRRTFFRAGGAAGLGDLRQRSSNSSPLSGIAALLLNEPASTLCKGDTEDFASQAHMR